MIELTAGFVLGLVSSGHCAAMCGPLMLAWRHQAPGAGHARILLLYHTSRVGMYAVFGWMAGLAGGALSVGRFSSTVSIGSGLLLLIAAATRAGLRVPRWTGFSLGRTLGRSLARIRRRAEAQPARAAVVAGALNAFLPCGLLYAALVAAVAVANPPRAALTMVMYGLGTTPALAGVWWSAGAFTRLTGRRLAFVAPVVLAITGGLLIGRGMTVPDAHSNHRTAVAAQGR